MVIIDELSMGPIPESLKGRLAQIVCRRRYGVGSDGLIFINKPDKADFSMRMFNPDGTEDMCGNGLRCVAKYLFKKASTGKNKILIETIAGIKEAEYLSEEEIKVNMGKPIIEPSSLPIVSGSVKNREKFCKSFIKIKNRRFDFILVSMGTPHAVIISDSQTIEKFFPFSNIIENSKVFTERVNVDWVEISDRDNIKVRVWERGAGETFSCGTGACSAMASSRLSGLVDESVNVRFRGGVIRVLWNGYGGDMRMTGPVDEVYRGVITIPVELEASDFLPSDSVLDRK